MSQTLANHRKRTPLYLLSLIILAGNAGFAIYRLIRWPGLDTGLDVAGGLALVVGLVYARVFTLTVQNRVIRLEMRLRMKELLPADLQRRIEDFTVPQLIALRFASDAELPALAAKVLADGIQDQTTIKKMIVNWKADYLRA